MWYEGVVLKGKQEGRTIGFPTINLDPTLLSSRVKEGIYAANVKYQHGVYTGALYFGPRLIKNESHSVLEIHILDFNKEIYGERIRFQLGTFTREIRNFASMGEMKRQIEQDINDIRQLV